MPIAERELLELASLARLEFDDAERRRLAQDLGRILDYVDRVRQGAGAAGSAPAADSVQGTGSAHAADSVRAAGSPRDCDEATPLREDHVIPPIAHDLALGQAPDRARGHFRVPRGARGDEDA